MKKTLFQILALLALGAAASVSVTDVKVRQRYPWNGLVDIDYTLAGDTSGMSVSIAVSNLETGVCYTPTKFGGPLPSAAGTHRVTWSTEEEGVDCISTNMLATVSLMCPVDAVTNNLYMVVDLSGGPNATSNSVTYLSSVPPGGWTDEYKTDKLVLRKIYPGAFSVGDVQHGASYEGVTLTNGYYLGVFETTQRQWELVTGAWPSAFSNAACAAMRPVETIAYTNVFGKTTGKTWPNAAPVDETSFMGLLRMRTGLSGFNLPTEAQWEYACRAGTTTDFNDGGRIEYEEDWDPCMSRLGRYAENSGYPTADMSCDATTGTAQVGSYAPNAWGLYDMHGNVQELCFDLYADGFEKRFKDGPVEPRGPSGTSRGRVGRGGDWTCDAQHCSSYARVNVSFSSRNNATGFRVACVVGPLAPDDGVTAEHIEEVASGSASWSLDTRAGKERLVVDGSMNLAWSGLWNGNTDSQVSVRVKDGATLVTAVTGEGGYRWTPVDSGDWTLQHATAGGETLESLVHVPYKSIVDATVTLGPSLTYTGNLQTQIVASVVVDGVPATYTVSGNAGIRANAYELAIEGVGNYTGTVTRTWSIARAENRWTSSPAIAGWCYGDPVSEPTAAAAFGAWTIAYSATPVQAGDYVATFTVEGTDDYTGLSTDVPFTIAPNRALVSIENALGGAGRVTSDENGWKVVLTNGVEGTLELPDNLGPITVDLAGQNLVGDEGQPAIRIANTEDEGEATALTIVDSEPDDGVDVRGGAGADGNPPETGAAGIEVAADCRAGALVNLGESVSVCGGTGGADTSGAGHDGIGGPAVVGQIGTNRGTVVRTAIPTPVLEPLIYTGGSQQYVNDDNPFWSVWYSAFRTDVGESDVMLQLRDTAFYVWASTENDILRTTFSVAPRDIAQAEVTLGPALSAHADEQEQTVESVTVDGLPVTYDVTGNRATVLGDYELTITGTGNFTGTVTRTWSIGNNVHPVGVYSKWTLPELGVAVPSAGTVYEVKVYGLPAGLKLKSNAAVKNKKGKVVTPAKTDWWIEGVPTVAIDWNQLPIYAVVTVGKTTTTTPVYLTTLVQDVVDLGELPLGTAIVTNACDWLDAVTNGWTVTGLPTGLKFAAKAVYSGSGAKKKLLYPASTIYGKTTKAGFFTVTAKKKVSSFYETLKYRVVVPPKAIDTNLFGEELADITTTAYESYSNAVPVRVDKVAGLPPGLVFAAKDVFAYENAKKKTGKYLKQVGQTIVGRPTKPGKYVVTFTKNVKSGKTTVAKTAQIVWTIEANPLQPELAFNFDGAETVESLVGVLQTDLLAFTVSPGATVKASGLPKGVTLVKLDDGRWGFKGVASAATTSFVTVTATVNGNSQSQRLAVRFAALPAWARGAFDGGVEGSENAEELSGTVKLSMTTAGKISGTLRENGTNWTLSAACYTGSGFDETGVCTNYICTNVVAKYTYSVKSGKKTVKKSVSRQFSVSVFNGTPLGSRTCSQVTGSEVSMSQLLHPSTFTAYQNEWSSVYKAIGTKLFYKTKKVQYRTYTYKPIDLPEGVLSAGETLSLKITPKGVVTATLTHPTGLKDKKTKKAIVYKPVCSTTLVPMTDASLDEAFKGLIFLYFPSSPANKFEGLGICGVFEDDNRTSLRIVELVKIDDLMRSNFSDFLL